MRRLDRRAAEQAAFEARWADALCDFCDRVIEFRDGDPYCATCEMVLDTDNLVKWRDATKIGSPLCQRA